MENSFFKVLSTCPYITFTQCSGGQLPCNQRREISLYLVIREVGHHTLEGRLSAQCHRHVPDILGDHWAPARAPAVH